MLFGTQAVRNSGVAFAASGKWLPVEIVRPNKRIYPQYTDGGFARIIRDLDHPLPFTTWSEPKREGPYYGKTHVDETPTPK